MNRSGSKRKKIGQKMAMQPKGGIVINKKGFDLGKSNAALYRPTHTIMFLTLSSHQVVGFLYSIAGITQTEAVPKSIAGDMVLMLPKIAAQVCNTVDRAQESLV